MKAIAVRGEPGHPELRWEEAPAPEYGPADVLVDVKATAVNRADLSQARGNYPPPPGASEILGLEMAGEVRAVGPDVFGGWRPGDRVFALLPGGGYAEQVAVPSGMLIRIPDNWSYTDAAAVPEVWLTAYLNLFIEGGLKPGETALLHAGASGVGTAGIQLVVDAGSRAFVTVGSDEKAERCRELGATLAINYKAADFVAAVMEATDGKGVDVILDPVGGPYLARNVTALARFGRLIQIGLLAGPSGELNLGQVMGKRLRIIGSTLRNRPLNEKIALTRRFETEILPKLACGQLKPIIDRVFPIAQAQDAHQYVLENRNTGKVVLSLA
jgi:putative PIG3 family NAD(P)H quinone oxidoreductase